MAFDWFSIFPQLGMSREERLTYRRKKWDRKIKNFFSFWDELIGGPPEEEGKNDRAADGYQIIGIKNLSQRHKTDSGDNVLTQTTQFRTAGDWDDLKADAARLEFTNSTGSAVIIKECTLIGKLILRNSGMFIHDKFKDGADIEKNGENAIEYASDDMSTNAHTSNVATYLWQKNLASKHYYSVEMKGSCYWLHPGIWARLTAGGAGQSENIDSVVRLEGVITQRRPGSLGTTSLLLVEVKENWKYDSTFKARTIANAVPWRNPQGASVWFVASSTGTEIAHGYCEGSADQTIIQAFINAASDNGGGVVHLGQGTFVTSAAIEMKSNVTLEMETGTIIEKNCNDYAIEAVGGSGTELTNIIIRGGKITRNAADTNSNALIYFSYVDDSTIQDCLIENSYYSGIYLSTCDNCIIDSIRINKFRVHGIYFNASENLTISKVTIDNTDNSIAATHYGIESAGVSPNLTISDSIIKNMTSTLNGPIGVRLQITDSLISNLAVRDLTTSYVTGTSYGIIITSVSNRCRIINCNIDNIDNSTTPANAYGIYYSGDDGGISNTIIQNCSGTSIVLNSGADNNQIIGNRFVNNGTNAPTDSGAGNTLANNDAT